MNRLFALKGEVILLNRVNSYRSVRVAKYIRLSREDGDEVESESVENQRDIIDNYILEHEELFDAGEYVDDGFQFIFLC